MIARAPRDSPSGHVYASLRRVEAWQPGHPAGAPAARCSRCIASHHGPPEGRRFAGPEAVALHAANQLDARVGEARSAQRFDQEELADQPALAVTPSPIGQETPVPPRPQ